MPDREEKAEQLRKELLDEDNYNRPTICAECGGIMVFKGVGEYKPFFAMAAAFSI